MVSLPHILCDFEYKAIEGENRNKTKKPNLLIDLFLFLTKGFQDLNFENTLEQNENETQKKKSHIHKYREKY